MPGHSCCIYPQHFNQDPLEHHFAGIRGAHGANRHPDQAACMNAAQNSSTMRMHFNKKENSGGAPLDMREADRPMLKRKGPKRAPKKPGAASSDGDGSAGGGSDAVEQKKNEPDAAVTKQSGMTEEQRRRSEQNRRRALSRLDAAKKAQPPPSATGK